MKARFLAVLLCIFGLCNIYLMPNSGTLNIFTATALASDDMTDLDYDFIDNAFSNPNPTTNKQFEDVMKQYENREPNGIFYKLKKFLNRNNPEYDKNLKKQYENPNNQPKRIKDTAESKPTITIGADFYDSTGKLLEAGHYQVEHKEFKTNAENAATNQSNYTINLLQGKTRVGEIKAILYEDDWDEAAIIYARTVNVQEDLVRIIYSNLDLTLQGYIRLLK